MNRPTKATVCFYERDGELWFRLVKEAPTQPAEPFIFDGPATPGHIEEYEKEYKIYNDSKIAAEMKEAAQA